MSEARTSMRRADEDDIPFIMSVERLPGYSERVGAWSDEEHRAKMRDAGFAYFLCLLDGVPAGFAILKDIGDGMGNLCLRRIAVGAAGQGVGTAFIRLLCDWAFGSGSVDRFWLDVLPSNASARHVYRKIGFVEEGLMRQALRYPDGRRADLILMSLLRPEWRALPADAAR